MADSDVEDVDIFIENRRIFNVPRVFRLQFNPFDAFVVVVFNIYIQSQAVIVDASPRCHL
jgi:hypothetical protein